MPPGTRSMLRLIAICFIDEGSAGSWAANLAASQSRVNDHCAFSQSAMTGEEDSDEVTRHSRHVSIRHPSPVTGHPSLRHSPLL